MKNELYIKKINYSIITTSCRGEDAYVIKGELKMSEKAPKKRFQLDRERAFEQIGTDRTKAIGRLM